MSDQGLSYSASGVDIDSAQQSLRSVSESIAETYNDQVIGGIGSFGAMFSAQFAHLDNPVLVSSIDGVGTKTKVAQMAGDFSGIGHDIVNHCVNDILCQGAKPLFFLDYFGCSKLESNAFNQIVTGAAEACKNVGCVLIGGETAEMPGVYVDGEIDIVGTIVGIADSQSRLPKPNIKPGDRIIGLPSNGLHTNGYSLARRALFDLAGLSVRDPLPTQPETTIAEALLAPHTCYYPALQDLLTNESGLLGLAHITGGGLTDNIPRILPNDLSAKIVRRAWEPLPIFKAIQELADVSDTEMFRAFNMGIGMVLIVDQDSSNQVIEHLATKGMPAAEIGKIQKGVNEVQIV